jgi:hypothetical protein
MVQPKRADARGIILRGFQPARDGVERRQLGLSW